MPINETNPLREPYWDKQKYETAQAYRAFRVYLRMPYGATVKLPNKPETSHEPADRSLSILAQWLYASKTLVANWSRSWKWQDRVAAYDKVLRRAEDKERARVRMQYARTLEERAMQYRNDAAELYPQLLEKVRHMLSFPVVDEKVVESPDGTGDTIVMKPAEWNLGTLATLIRSTESLARFAAGTERQGVLDRYLDNIDPAALTPEQRRRIVNGEPILEVLVTGGALEPKTNGAAEPVENATT